MTKSRWWVTCAIAVVLFTYIGYAGVVAPDNGAKHIDSHQFYVAGKCWLRAQSPYQIKDYHAMVKEILGNQHWTFFYFPAAITYCVPMALLDPSTSVLFQAFLSLIACGVISYLCWHHFDPPALDRCEWLRKIAGLFILLSVSAIPSTIYTGQSSVLAVAGLLLCWAGLESGRFWPLVLGLWIASCKPHITGAPFLIMWLSRIENKSIPKALLLVAVASVAILFIGDPHPWQSVPESLAEFSNLSINNPARLIGMMPLLLWVGINPPVARIICVILFISLVICVIGINRVKYKGVGIRGYWGVLPFVFTGLLMPFQQYDLIVYAPLFFTALIPRLGLWVGVTAIALLWRQSLVELLHLPVPINVVVSLGWLVLLCLTLADFAFPRKATERAEDGLSSTLALDCCGRRAAGPSEPK